MRFGRKKHHHTAFYQVSCIFVPFRLVFCAPCAHTSSSPPPCTYNTLHAHAKCKRGKSLLSSFIPTRPPPPSSMHIQLSITHAKCTPSPSSFLPGKLFHVHVQIPQHALPLDLEQQPLGRARQDPRRGGGRRQGLEELEEVGAALVGAHL